MGWQQRALLSLVVGILVASAFGRNVSADPVVLAIQYVQVTNVTERAFVVTWTTNQTVASGSILYGTSPGSLISLLPETIGPRGDVHRVLVQTSAAPGTTIYFDVKSGAVVDNNGGAHYRVSLGQSLGTYPSPVTVAGRVLQGDGRTPAAGVLVTAWAIDYNGLNGASAGSVTTSLPLSAVTDSTGTWTLLLETRTLDGAAFFKYTMNGTDQIKYSVTGGGLGQTSATILPLSPSPGGQVSAPAVSLIASSATPTPSQTATNGPVPTSTRSAIGTLSPSATSMATATTSATPAPFVSPTATVEDFPTLPPEDTPAPDEPIPLPTEAPAPPLLVAAPTPTPRAAFSPTASVPRVQPAVPNLIPAPPTPTSPPIAPSTLPPRPVLTEGAWPDRSTPTATPSPAHGTVTPELDAGPGATGSELPAGIGLLLIVGASLLGLGSLGVAVALVEARKAA